MNIVLTGFMGTGKSVVGRHLAQELHAPFADVDARSSNREKRPIAEIFATKGEPAFRKFESEVIAELGSAG